MQGVFYRKSARDQALILGLTGEVKNQEDGSVLIIASGEPDQLKAFADWCRQGPPRAVVTEVITAVVDPKRFQSFEIVR